MRLMSVAETHSTTSILMFFHSSLQTWSKLMHPHILRKLPRRVLSLPPFETSLIEFLGANILDDKPFIVMPFLKNGNARDYIYEHPECNRAKIVRFSYCMRLTRR